MASNLLPTPKEAAEIRELIHSQINDFCRQQKFNLGGGLPEGWCVASQVEEVAQSFIKGAANLLRWEPDYSCSLSLAEYLAHNTFLQGFSDQDEGDLQTVKEIIQRLAYEADESEVSELQIARDLIQSAYWSQRSVLMLAAGLTTVAAGVVASELLVVAGTVTAIFGAIIGFVNYLSHAGKKLDTEIFGQLQDAMKNFITGEVEDGENLTPAKKVMGTATSNRIANKSAAENEKGTPILARLTKLTTFGSKERTRFVLVNPTDSSRLKAVLTEDVLNKQVKKKDIYGALMHLYTTEKELEGELERSKQLSDEARDSTTIEREIAVVRANQAVFFSCLESAGKSHLVTNFNNYITG